MWVYLLHFDAPLGNERHQAQHYIGTAGDLETRIETHRQGRGAKITAAAVERGISFRVVRVWPGGRDVERWLKRRKEAGQLCPCCAGAAAWRRAVVLPPTVEQLPLPLETAELAPWDRPDYMLPPAKADALEILTTRRWREARAVPARLPDPDDDLL